MKTKGWRFSRESGTSAVELGHQEGEGGIEADGGQVPVERVLGLLYLPEQDVFVFKLKLNITPKIRGVFVGPDLTLDDLESDPPQVLTRRLVLSQTAKIFDPLGLLTPVLLTAKLLMRETWNSERKLDWDDPLCESLRNDFRLLSHSGNGDG